MRTFLKAVSIVVCILLLCGCRSKDVPETIPAVTYESITQMRNVVDGVWFNCKTGFYVVVENGLLISYDENNVSSQLNKLLNTSLSFDDYCKSFSTDCATKVDYDYTNGRLLDSETKELIFRLYDEESAFDSNSTMYDKKPDKDWLEDSLLNDYIDAMYPNILTNKDVQFNKTATLGQLFMIEGTAKLDDYYNWGYRNFEATHFCINIRPVGGSYSDEWTVYASRSEFKELYDDLMNGSKRIYVIAKTEFADTGIDCMATLVEYFD